MTAHSTVPRWPAEPPVPDPTGRSYVLVGWSGCPVASAWARAVDGRPLRRVRLPDLPQALADSHVGVRLLAAGPEHEVLAAAAVAAECGMIDDELLLYATSADERAVYCVHCARTCLVRAEVGAVADCPSCGRGLEIFEHLSRRSGSYLGFQADAEELP